MAAAAKTHIAEKGGNPKIVTIVAFGGAGPVHAYGLAKKLGAPRLLVPPNAGVGSALGFFTAPRAFDLLRSHKVSLGASNYNEIEKIFRELEAEAAKILKKEATEKDIKFERSLDMRFVGQGAETNVPISERDFTKIKKEEVRRRFDEVYVKLYGRTYPDSEVEFINFKVRASLPERLLQLPKLDKKRQSLDQAIKGKRPAYSPVARDFIPYTVYDRYKISPNAKFRGPAIIEEKESTVIVGEDALVSTDDFGFLWIDISTAPESALVRRGQKRRSLSTSAYGRQAKKPKALARKKPKR
jgi:N-methylhydantoinase A/oxoprolinase/acetone carboxylase beta subunit